MRSSGLESDALAVYQYAVHRGVLRAETVHEALGWPRERVAVALEHLRTLQLLVPLGDSGCTFGVSSPRSAASLLLAPLHRRMESLDRAASTLLQGITLFQEAYENAVHEPEHGKDFRSLVGFDAINHEIEAAAERCGSSVLTAQPGGGRDAASLEAAWPSTRALLQRGVRMRTIYQHSARFHAETRRYVTRVRGYGADVRTLDEFFDRMVIFDREVAFIPAGGDPQMALAVHQPAVVEFLIGVFERFWKIGSVFPDKQDAHSRMRTMSDMRVSIVRFLAEGETDEVIAKRLGISVRTCRSHISKIYEEFGARSRCQLGVLIARSGVLADGAGGGARPHDEVA
ncbi:helix-turn-helix transcriptional regulator [Streptomyces nitrosporeus]|uniref:helix-turn-helix transcriptional regulator n=1 Tax=Streptomyces nitrosporeus TaxID=28894 RepID=UPI0039A3F202